MAVERAVSEPRGAGYIFDAHLIEAAFPDLGCCGKDDRVAIVRRLSFRNLHRVLPPLRSEAIIIISPINILIARPLKDHGPGCRSRSLEEPGRLSAPPLGVS